MEQKELDKILQLIGTHDANDDLGYCDTGSDMEYGCRSECTEMAASRVNAYFKDKITN